MNEAEGIHNYSCDCQPGWHGPYCDVPTAMSFTGSSWAAALHTSNQKDLDLRLSFRYIRALLRVRGGIQKLNFAQNVVESLFRPLTFGGVTKIFLECCGKSKNALNIFHCILSLIVISPTKVIDKFLWYSNLLQRAPSTKSINFQRIMHHTIPPPTTVS